MSGLDFNQVEAALDTFDPLVKPIHATVYSRHAFFDMRHPDLQVLYVVNKPIDTLFHSPQARLDLLQHRHDEVGDFAHVHQCTCSGHVPQVRTLSAEK